MPNTSCQCWCSCHDRKDNRTYCNVLRKFPGLRWHRYASAPMFSCQRRLMWSLLQTRDLIWNKEWPVMLEHQYCAKSTGTCSLTICCLSMPSSAVIQLLGYSAQENVSHIRSDNHFITQAGIFIQWHIKRRRSSPSLPVHSYSGWHTR